MVNEVYNWCTTAQKGCTDCKKNMGAILADKMKPIYELRQKLEKENGLVDDILKKGKAKASAVAQDTLREVKSLLHLYKGAS